ncbi:MAG: tyrosine--tRNA ligase [candidate division SR1 bacterium]|nr:tyrosine--tRNA ligase [candidate division SR1 bacterium]
MQLREEREKRGLFHQFSDEKLFDMYSKGGESFYLGCDPSADSLQLGNVCALMAAVNLMKYGNKCFFLVGGATGMIGDPSLKDAERTYLGEEQLRYNEKRIYDQIKNFLENLQKKFGLKFDYEMVDNYDFYTNMNFLTFLTDVGQYITVNTMIAKESVKKRITDPDKSITYAEFSYMLIQGYDFSYLYKNKGVKLQLGGSDQRGNVTTGIEIIRKKYDQEAYGVTIPLITDASGKKFGKSEGNAIWLDHEKTSPYFVYQYFMNTNDEDVGKYFKVLTLLDVDEVDKIVAEHMKKPELRYGQKELAKAVIEVLFDKESAEQAEKISEVLFGEGDKMTLLSGFSKGDVDALMKEVGGTEVKVGSEGVKFLDICTASGLTESNGEAKKMIQSGSLFCNEVKVEDPQMIVTKNNFVNGMLLLRKGKKVFKVVKK